jgi:glycosyltransferase involved in cell wall biosynthesis
MAAKPFIGEVTPLLITYNEIENIARTLAKLGWAGRIVVIDSGSSDGTLEVLAKDSRVEVHRRPFDSFAEQCNFGLSLVKTEWVLSMDADYELSEELVAELGRLTPSIEQTGYRARFVYRIHGRPLRGTLYPPRTVLYRTRQGRYESEGHGHRIRLTGAVSPLRGVIYHDDRKPLARWFNSQLNYAGREAAFLLQAPTAELTRMDRIRRMGWPAPFVVVFYVLFAKGALLDGPAGWYYAFQRMMAEVLVALELLDRRLRDG